VVPPSVNDMRDTLDAAGIKKGLIPARCPTPTMVERPKSARQARELLLMRMFAWVSSSVLVCYVAGRIKPLSSLRVPCEVCACTPTHSLRRPAELTNYDGFHGMCDITHELDTINLSALLHIFIDVTVNHPFGYHGELVPF